jgi:hypothetical protein
MKLSKSRLSIILLAFSLIFQGCLYYKLAGPAQEEKSIKTKTTSHKYAYTVKIRYTGNLRRGMPAGNYVPVFVVENALHDSFSHHGIYDVIKSEKLEADRINIVAYSGYEPDLAADNILLRALYIPWGLVTLATFGLVPNYGVMNYPVEIHIINPVLEHDKQLKIIQTNYNVAHWWWFPFAFVSNDNTPEDVYYGANDYAKVKKIDYLGWRRIFDRVIAEMERN